MSQVEARIEPSESGAESRQSSAVWRYVLPASLLWLAVVWMASSPNTGDLCHHYTDHLRHMGEALALGAHGFHFYELPYAEATAGLALPCPAHENLFGDRTAPYPPFGILLHLPFAWVERAGWLSPAVAHRAVVLFWSLVACATCALMGLQLRGQPRAAWLGFGLLFVPLCLGMGANGFFDVGFLFFGVLAARALSRGQPGAGLVALAFSAAAHFRAAVFAPLAIESLVRGLRARPRATAIGVLLGIGVVIPSAVAAALLLGTLETIPAHNPVHHSHLKLRLLVFLVVCLGISIWLWRRQERTVALTCLTAMLLGIFERSHGWWHASVLLAPAVALAAKPGIGGARAWLAVWGFALLTGFIAYKHPLSPYWQWVEFAIRGVR